MAITYRITPQINNHVYKVHLSFTATSGHQELKLPVWIPGSYMVREFSKQIINVNPINTNHVVNQINKNTWNITGLNIGSLVELEYLVYAYEYGIRTAFLDFNRGYFNPTSVCLAVAGNEASPHTVTFEELPANWQVATGLKNIADTSYVAANYDELIDSPFELGKFERITFNVAGVPHYLVLSGVIPEFDRERIITDMTKVCEFQIKMFGGVAPYDDYTFILNLSGEIYTGLEHRNSTLLMAPYYALPNLAKTNDTDYHKLMGLISHEFFHTWNVKRIKPKVFTPYDLDQENYTKLLWWFEGVTSYYDDLVLYRTGVITQEQYLQLIVDALNNVYKFAGVKLQSLANSSLTSWIKYYRQDENSPNSIVSYYVKGSLVALCLDLLIRKDSAHSLDDVMLHLYKEWCANPIGVGENEIPHLIKAATGIDLSDFIHLATETVADIPFAEIFAEYGLDLISLQAGSHQDSGKYTKDKLEQSNSSFKADLGMKLEKQAHGYLVKNVYKDASGEKNGFAAGDLLIAINNVKLSNLERQLAFYSSGEVVKISLFRQEQLLEINLKLEASNVGLINLRLINSEKLLNWL
ncbi:M61 family metallopeptidase [Aquella oligotrophica]|uniref:Peptidase M61 n=1 Tax=Aquella oligotrophica TaxID=2067065 RepID=A0A2I7N3F3_9NEIS|nr:PDZ domain-containing protein [Aquella oligotrophica]AUR50987.1 peptidase M61 [Aquella oligotrophica]